MRFYWILTLVHLSLSAGQAQNEPGYFQQEAHYRISVRLDDQRHTLSGHWQMRYVNRSPDTLQGLYLHLWPNAYKNNYTEFAKQKLDAGDLSFHFAKKEERGFIDELAFSCNGQSLQWRLLEDTADVAWLQLPAPLPPGGEVELQTPFFVKLPKTVSRLGHEGQSYQITQWYPKPAVYDRQGWHYMPYLDQGEFYSEFGSFDVQITLPANYVVAATGNLQTDSEWDFLRRRMEESARLDFDERAWSKRKSQPPFPPSDTAFKTLHYTAERVHDFAWFADKRFHVLKRDALLSSGRRVQCFAFFTDLESDLWKEAAGYTARAIEFYSDQVGEYPYDYMSSVQGALEAGGGMEYPMVTVIGEAGSGFALDVTIAHEVGHNWFYGILATNERDYPWLDEGFNSYIESKYTETYYQQKPRLDYLAYLYQAYRGAEQPIQTHSNLCTPINYFLSAYAKPTLALRYLEDYLGKETMREALHAYFDTWQFKHPQPQDVQYVFEGVTGKNLAWFFVDLVQTTGRIDYGWGHCARGGKCHIKQKGELSAPFSVAAFSAQDSLLDLRWIEPSQGASRGERLPFDPHDAPQGTAYWRIDAAREMPEYNRNDNIIRLDGLFRRGISPRVRLLANFRRPEHPTLGLLPVVGYNQYDGVLVGLSGYNMPIPSRPWQVSAMPLLGTGSLKPIGALQIQHHHLPLESRIIERFSSSLGFRTFHSNTNKRFGYETRYWRMRLAEEIEFARPENSRSRQSLQIEHLLIGEEKPRFEIQPDTVLFVGKPIQWRSLHRLTYTYQNNHALHPLVLRPALEYGNYRSSTRLEHFLKLSVEGNFRLMYSPLFGVDIRLFAGGFLMHSDRRFGAFPLQLVSRNRNDYFFDNYFVARNAQDNFWSQQVGLTDGAFKTPIPQVVGYANSNIFIFALNLKADIPIKLPFRTKWVKLKPYLDFGYYKNSHPAVVPTSPAQEFLFNGGLMVDIGDGMMGLYLPLFGDKQLMGWLRGKGNYFSRIGFSINFNRINPVEFARKFDFY